MAIGDQLIDRIYEAAVVPEMWRDVLADFTRFAGGKDSVLFTARGTHARWIASSPRFDETVRAHFEMFPAGNERTNRLAAKRHAGFVTDLDVFTPEEIATEPVFRDFFSPRGYGGGVATAIAVPSGDAFVVHAECDRGHGPVGRDVVARLNPLRPHFARAALLSSRLELERARGAAAALEALGLPGAMLGSGGRALAANALLTSLVPDVVQDRPSRLALVNATADALLARAVSRAEAMAGAAVGSIPIPAQDDRPPMIVHVLPICGAARDVFASTVAMLVVTPVVPRDVPTATVIQALFDLTPAEARLAEIIGSGSQPREAAASLGIAEQTARTTLKRVFAKTGVGRQAELVALLNGGSR